MSETTFRVGDRVRYRAGHHGFPGDHAVRDHGRIDEYRDFVYFVGVGGLHDPANLELVDEKPRFQIEDVLPLIKDARAVRAALDLIDPLVLPTMLSHEHPEDSLSGVLERLHTEIGKKVAESVEVDA